MRDQSLTHLSFQTFILFIFETQIMGEMMAFHLLVPYGFWQTDTFLPGLETDG